MQLCHNKSMNNYFFYLKTTSRGTSVTFYCSVKVWNFFVYAHLRNLIRKTALIFREDNLSYLVKELGGSRVQFWAWNIFSYFGLHNSNFSSTIYKNNCNSRTAKFEFILGFSMVFSLSFRISL